MKPHETRFAMVDFMPIIPLHAKEIWSGRPHPFNLGLPFKSLLETHLDEGMKGGGPDDHRR
jgi:hypothetical protein